MKSEPQAAQRSPLGERIHARMRDRHHERVPVQGYFALGHEVAEVAIRVATSREQDRALMGAHAYVVAKARDNEAAKRDDDLVLDAKAAHIVAEMVRDPSTPEMLPVWPSGEMVKEDLSADQIGVLLRLCNHVRSKFGPVPESIDDSTVEAWALMAATLGGTDTPDLALAALPHTYLVQLFILTAGKLADARARIVEAQQPANKGASSQETSSQVPSEPQAQAEPSGAEPSSLQSQTGTDDGSQQNS